VSSLRDHVKYIDPKNIHIHTFPLPFVEWKGSMDVKDSLWEPSMPGHLSSNKFNGNVINFLKGNTSPLISSGLN